MTRSGWLPLDESAAAFAQFRSRVELQLLEAVFADVDRGPVVAGQAGITPWHFERPDLHVIFLAAQVCRGFGVTTTLRIAIAALMTEGLWDETQIAGNYGTSVLWSAETLGRLPFAMFYSEAIIVHRAKKLIDLYERQHQAEDLYRDLTGKLHVDHPRFDKLLAGLTNDDESEGAPVNDSDPDGPMFVLADGERGAR